MMALSGVRNSCDMLARNSDLARFAASARSVSFMYLRLSSTSSRDRSSSARRARLRSWIVAISRRSLSTSFSWCSLIWVMSEPTETVPPSLVLSSLTCSQRPSASCRSKVAPPCGPLVLASRRSEAKASMRSSSTAREAPGITSRSDRPLSCWYLELHMIRRWAESHSTKDSLMFSIAGPQPQVGRLGAQRQMALLGDVDGDADQLDLRRFRVDDLRPGAHPHPLSVGMPHAEHLVDVIDLAFDDPVGELEQVAVLGVDDVVDFAERQHRVAGLVAQHVVHRARPVHLAAHHVPVPQAAAAANQRHVDALMRFEVDAVGRLGARRLAEIGVEDDDQHAGRQHEQGDVERDGLAPAVEDRFLRHQHCRGILPVICQADRRIPVLTADADIHDAGAVAEHEQWLAALDEAVERSALPACRPRRHGNDLESAVGDRQAHGFGPWHPGGWCSPAGPGWRRAPRSDRRRANWPVWPAASARIALALRSTSSRSFISDRTRSAAMTIRKMMMRAGIDRRSSGSAARSRR